MNDAVSIQTSAYAQVRIREPAGERTLGETLSIGGAGADVVVPGTDPGVVLSIERGKGVWIAKPAGGGNIPRFNGKPLTGARDLQRDDVLGVGDAQIIVTDVSRTLLRLDVRHLVGNATVAPAGTLAALALGEGGDEELEIHAPGTLRVPPPAVVDGAAPAAQVAAGGRARRWWIPVAVGLALLAAVIVSSLLESVPLDIRPNDARVRTPGTLLSIRSGDRLLLLPGKHVVRAERDGYSPAQADIVVRSDALPGVRLRLAKLPGKLDIDTGGVAATVSIDGVVAGHAPGVMDVPPGTRTIAINAPRYVEYITSLVIEGAGVRQELQARLQPSWGTLQISTVPGGAHVSVDDGAESGIAPAAIAAPSGVRHIEISAPGWKTWAGSVVLKAGETLAIGPVTLGQPDAHLSLRSSPAGAEATVAGVHRGRTPVEVDLPAGIPHEVVLNLPGYATWSQSLFADPGHRFSLDARLEPVVARVSVQGEPADAQVVIDGAVRGHAPQSLDLSAIEHRIEIRKEGFVPFTGTVTPAAGLERKVQYHLLPADRSKALAETAPTVTSSTGYVLRLVPGGTFQMGSDRREQGRRPNEGFRPVTLKRPFYLGVMEVTNGEFRKFHAEHVSGFIGTHSIDLDNQPVTQVPWNEAAEYCNWLSERDSLPPAYEKRGDRYVLKRPVPTGYRLPTEAEWEYAARYAGPGQTLRFAWGDSPPVPDQVGNLAGSETGNSLQGTLPNYHDDYPAIAPVGKFRPSRLGLHDLSGNVSEWVNDYYISYVDPAPVTDPLGPDEGSWHVIRGANWKSANITELRLAWRDGAETGSQTLGFRLARYAEPASVGGL